tara:strand:- start:59 stop:742 length:684 start_codon:yes stop_codon:yes gene_type:complete
MITPHDKCPECKSDLQKDPGEPYHSGSYGEPPDEGYPPTMVCHECGWEADPEEVDWNPKPTNAQQAMIDRIRKQLLETESKVFTNRVSPTFDQLFEGTPEGDFDWVGEHDESVKGSCDDSDCESDWHQYSQAINMGRKDGQTWYDVVDEDGQSLAGWDEREGDQVCQSMLDDLWFHGQGRIHDFFAGNIRYSLYVAETGSDPLGEWFKGVPSPDAAIKSAQNDLKYL